MRRNWCFVGDDALHRPVTDATIRCEYRFVLVQMGGTMKGIVPYEIPILFWFVQIRGRAMLAPTISISFLKFFGSEEEEKTIEYRFFNDVTKTRRVSRRVYRAVDDRLCFRKIENFFPKKFFASLTNTSCQDFSAVLPPLCGGRR